LSVENGKDMLAYKGQIEITKHTKFFWKSAQRISFTKIASRIVMKFFQANASRFVFCMQCQGFTVVGVRANH
jgi:hypothetical protein